MKTLIILAFHLITLNILNGVQSRHLDLLPGLNNGIINHPVVGGTAAQEGDAPYQISLQNLQNYHLCGGAIIDKEWIITASHCVEGRNETQIKIVTDTLLWKKPGAIYFADSIFMHSLYRGTHNDIALIHLNSSIEFNNKTQPIALPTQQMVKDDEVVLTGWGSIEAWGEDPDELQKVSLKYLPHDECEKALDYDRDLDIGHICTFTKRGEGSCHGDSGGPLVSNGYLVGLVNWGWPCATGYPDAHASTLFYGDWIRRTMSGFSKCY